MFSYLKEEELLFSQDAFGMHLATSCLFADENCEATMAHEFKTYFANILTPYSGQILKLLESFGQLKLPVKIVAPDHGPLWRGEGISHALEQYRIWSEQKPEARALVVYDTMWKSTASMANSIADGIRQHGGIKVDVIELSDSFRSDVATELLCAGIFAVGSPTLNNNLFPRTADALTYLKGLRFKNLLGAAFASYGWSGESLGQINDALKAMDVELLSEGIKVKYVPTAEDLSKCFDLGQQLAAALKNKLAAK
ncbi:MAG: hypothetical protein A2X49_06730 [Lentisphaerae bacterium GWF2_52_8]|nr:MAG: hypothetical protein A2X49_06730 [Lentisphaerae bacterium GWF2_52_8]